MNRLNGGSEPTETASTATATYQNGCSQSSVTRTPALTAVSAATASGVSLAKALRASTSTFQIRKRIPTETAASVSARTFATLATSRIY